MRHFNGTDNVCTPHELIIVVGLIIAGVIGIVIRIVVGFCELIAKAAVIFNNAVAGAVRIRIRSLAGGVAITGGDRNIHLAVILDGHISNRRIFHSNGICAGLIIRHGECHAAQCYRHVALAADLIVLDQLVYFAALQIIRQDAVGQAEVYLAIIVCGRNRNRRILLRCLCILRIQRPNQIVVIHCIGGRIIGLAVVEINQCYIRIIRICQCRVVINNLQLSITKNVSIRIVRSLRAASGGAVRAGILHIIAILIHDLQHIGGIIQIVRAITNLIGLALDESYPCILIGRIGCNILIQGNNVGKISVVQFACRRIAEHEIQMVHVAVCLNAVSVHAFDIDIGIAGVNIIPFTICLDCVPVVRRIEITRLTKHGGLSLVNDLNLVDNRSTVRAPDTVAVFIGFRRTIGIQLIVEFLVGFPVGSRVDASAVLHIDFRECTLNEIRICIGIAKAYCTSANQRANLCAFPQANDGIGSRSCLLRTIAIRVIRLILHIALSLCGCNCLCLLLAVLIHQGIIVSVMYLRLNHVVHALIRRLIKVALGRLRCFHLRRILHNGRHSEIAVICQPVIQCQILLNIRHAVIQRCQRLISDFLNLIAICLGAEFGSQVVDLYQTCHGIVIGTGFRNACNIEKRANRICIGILRGVVRYLNTVNIRMFLKALNILRIQPQQILCLLVRQIIYVGFFLQLICRKRNAVIHLDVDRGNIVIRIGFIGNVNQSGHVILFQYLLGCGVHFLRRNTVVRDICGVIVIVKDCIFNYRLCFAVLGCFLAVIQRCNNFRRGTIDFLSRADRSLF